VVSISDLTIGDIGTVTAPVSTPLVVTVQSIVDMTKRWLFTGGREAVNKLTSSVSANASSLTFTYDLGAIQGGARVSIDLEDYRVWSVSSPSATVEPGQYGSTSAAHNTGSLVFVNALFSQFEIVTEINNELLALSAPGSGLFQIKTVDLTYSPSFQAYNLTSVTDAEDILAVSYESLGPSREYIPIDSWRFQRNLPTGDFASGFALTLLQGADPGQTVRVAYKAPFTTLSSLSDDLVLNAGLPASARDVVAMGAALRLSTSREIRRNFNESQGDTRRASEVPPGANNAAPAGLRQKYLERRNEEAARLQRLFPPRRR
jgi:hypothetical protein